MNHPALARYPLALPGQHFLEVLHESEHAIIVLASAPGGQPVVIKRFKFDASKLDQYLVDEFLMESLALGLHC